MSRRVKIKRRKKKSNYIGNNSIHNFLIKNKNRTTILCAEKKINKNMGIFF